MRTRTLATALAILVCTSCNEDVEVSVRVCGDLLVPNDLDAVRVTAFDAAGNAVVVGVLPLVGCPEASLTHLPVTRILGALEGEHRILVQALEDELEIGRVELRVRFDGSTEVQLRLEKQCLGVPCPLGQTCIGGDCEVIPFAVESSMDCRSEVAKGPAFGEPSVHCPPAVALVP